MSVLDLFGKKGNVFIKEISLQELSKEPLPNSTLHYVNVPDSEYGGFRYKIFFSNPKHAKDTSYPHIVLKQIANSVDSGKPLTISIDENPLRDEVLKRLLPSSQPPIFARFSGGRELVTDIVHYGVISKALQDILGVGYPNLVEDKRTEIYGTFDLQQASPPSGRTLNQRSAAEYISRISNVSVFPEFKGVSAHYVGVRKRSFDKVNLKDQALALGFS